MEGKGSLLHQSVQRHIFQLLPPKEAFIEHRLPGHVADLVWLPQKIVFEIQCSSISIDTAIARTNDYKKLGFFIVWILHQKTFNGAYLSLAELFLRKQRACYFTNIVTTGHGYIYDQTETIRNNKRLQRSPPLLVDLLTPCIKKGKISFKGDRHQLREGASFLSTLAKRCKYLFNP